MVVSKYVTIEIGKEQGSIYRLLSLVLLPLVPHLLSTNAGSFLYIWSSLSPDCSRRSQASILQRTLCSGLGSSSSSSSTPLENLSVSPESCFFACSRPWPGVPFQQRCGYSGSFWVVINRYLWGFKVDITMLTTICWSMLTKHAKLAVEFISEISD